MFSQFLLVHESQALSSSYLSSLRRTSTASGYQPGGKKAGGAGADSEWGKGGVLSCGEKLLHCFQAWEECWPLMGRAGHFCGLGGFREIWEFKIFGCINPDVLISCVRALLFLKKHPGLGKDDLPWLA